MEGGMYDDMEIVPEWCDYCGVPLIADDGLHRNIGGAALVFCSKQCMGLYYQHQSVVI